MCIFAHQDEIASESDPIIPMLILEALAGSDRPMSLAEAGKTLDIEAARLQPHFKVLEEHAFIQHSGSQSTFVIGRRWLMLCAGLKSGEST
jgi:DNA-binding IclR family transcriptional regulator